MYLLVDFYKDLVLHIILFSGFCLDIEKAAVPAKCLLPIICVTLKVVCENILMISPCELTAAIIACAMEIVSPSLTLD